MPYISHIEIINFSGPGLMYLY
ncbi:hypothetical protein SBDP2_1070012 [Syntrophobacter sp. SbD2]|nr:hypothetical protein SBDP2_1070012 [Syntrophobacter sp. SbD2]